MKNTIAFAGAASLLSGFAPLAFSQSQINREAARPTEQQRSERGQREQGPEHLQKCIRDAASDNQMEIQVGQFVEQRSQNPQVKQLAQRLVQDHQRAQQQLQQAAEQLKVPVSDQLNPVHQAMWQELQEKQGEALDTAFVFSQVGDHEKDILKAQWQSQHEQTPQLKQYAQQQIPVLEEHLRMARRAAEQFVPEARQAGERMPGNTDRNRDQDSGRTNGVNGESNQGRLGGASGNGNTGGIGR